MTDNQRASAPGRASGEPQEPIAEAVLLDLDTRIFYAQTSLTALIESARLFRSKALSSPSVADSPTLETHHEALRLIEKLVERDCMNWQMCGHQTCQEVRRLLLPSAPSPSAAAQPNTETTC